MRWLSRIFNRNACVYQTSTRWDLPPYPITIWVIDWWSNVCLLDELILGFCYSDLTWETGVFELASTITLELQANRLTKCASHPKFPSWFPSPFLSINIYHVRFLIYQYVQHSVKINYKITRHWKWVLPGKKYLHVIIIIIIIINSNNSNNKMNKWINVLPKVCFTATQNKNKSKTK